jgi:hypothetical protein
MGEVSPENWVVVDVRIEQAPPSVNTPFSLFCGIL